MGHEKSRKGRPIGSATIVHLVKKMCTGRFKPAQKLSSSDFSFFSEAKGLFRNKLQVK
jgi:hypothetical protein